MPLELLHIGSPEYFPPRKTMSHLFLNSSKTLWKEKVPEEVISYMNGNSEFMQEWTGERLRIVCTYSVYTYLKILALSIELEERLKLLQIGNLGYGVYDAKCIIDF